MRVKNKNKIRPPASNFEEEKMRNKEFILSGLMLVDHAWIALISFCTVRVSSIIMLVGC